MRWTPEREGLLNQGPYYAPKTQLDAAGNRILWGWIEDTRPQKEFAKAGWAGCMSLPRVLTLQDGEVHFAPARQIYILRGSANPSRSAKAFEIMLRIRRDPNAKPVGITGNGLRVSSSQNAALFWNGDDVGDAFELPNTFLLRCFVNHSVVEVFVGDRIVLTGRVYGDKPCSPGAACRFPDAGRKHFRHEEH